MAQDGVGGGRVLGALLMDFLFFSCLDIFIWMDTVEQLAVAALTVSIPQVHDRLGYFGGGYFIFAIDGYDQNRSQCRGRT